MYQATKDLLNFAHEIDALKNKIFEKSYSIEDFAFVYKNDKIESLTLYWCFLNNLGEQAFQIELETIDSLIGKYSTYNAERLKAMTSILDGDDVFVNMFAFNIMVECFNNHNITAQTIEPYTAEEIAWACANIIGIKGADNFPFKGDALKYIDGCLIADSWEMPPMFLSFPKILDMFETKQIEHYAKVTNMLRDLHLKDLIEIASNRQVFNELAKTPHLLNYLVHNGQAAKYLIYKINKTGLEIQDIFLNKG